MFYYCLGNVLPQYRSSLRSIQLAAVAKSSVVEKYGFQTILEPFLESIKRLENVSLCSTWSHLLSLCNM